MPKLCKEGETIAPEEPIKKPGMRYADNFSPSFIDAGMKRRVCMVRELQEDEAMFFAESDRSDNFRDLIR